MVTFIAFLILLGVVVVVHEWGHFLVARRNGVRVLTFSFGFGPKLFSKTAGGTEYIISAIPLGGYVKLAGENLDEIQNQPDEFSSKTLWQRGKIVFAGPVANIVLAFILMPLVYRIGVQEPAYLHQPAKIGWVEDGSPAQKAGLQSGDLVLMAGHETVTTWKEVQAALMAGVSSLDVKRGEDLKRIPVSGPLSGLYPYFQPVVRKVNPGKPAERAGIQTGDKVVSIDGVPVGNFNHFFLLLDQNIGKEIKLEVLRKASPITVLVTPVYDERLKRAAIGVAMGLETVLQRYGWTDSVRIGSRTLFDSIVMTYAVLGKLIAGKMSLDVMGGPVQIAQMSGQAAHAGLGAFFSLMAMISVQLGIFNLLPIPVLDGGWLFFFILEAFQGKALSKKFIQVAQAIGFALLAGLILYVTINDILKMFR